MEYFVQLGFTDDSYVIEDSAHLSYTQLTEAFLPPGKKNNSLKSRVASFMGVDEKSDEIKLVEWTGIFENTPVGLDRATPAQVLQNLLEEKWKLKPDDKDMIVMQHQFEIRSEGPASKSEIRKVKSEIVVKGEDATKTAMAKTVGLPLAIASKLILNGKIKSRGVLVPVTKEIYEPVLKELEDYGIKFSEH